MWSIVRRVSQTELVGRAINGMAETCAHLANRVMYKPHVAWWNNREWLSPYEKYVDGNRILDRRFTAAKWAEASRRLNGSTAECGVYTGVTSAIICKTLEGYLGDNEFHYGFDSFEGLSQPVAVDAHLTDEDVTSYALKLTLKRQWRKGDLTCGIEVAAEKVKDFSFCRLVKGSIPECFSVIRNERFRFVHIDVDLFQPTWHSLVFFYPRLVSGGIVVFDDYGMLTCPGARAATDQFFKDKPENCVELSTGQAVMIKD
ncbi:MAG: TylF/MycF/NovP-related O-methyltransferase [Planctomycetaceae bacterium]